jgi:hypothetical protein
MRLFHMLFNSSKQVLKISKKNTRVYVIEGQKRLADFTATGLTLIIRKVDELVAPLLRDPPG